MVWFLEMGMSCDSGNHHIKASGSGSSLLLHIKCIHDMYLCISEVRGGVGNNFPAVSCM